MCHFCLQKFWHVKKGCQAIYLLRRLWPYEQSLEFSGIKEKIRDDQRNILGWGTLKYMSLFYFYGIFLHHIMMYFILDILALKYRLIC